MKSLYIVNMKGGTLSKSIEGGSIEIFDMGVKFKRHKLGFKDEVFVPMDEVNSLDIKTMAFGLQTNLKLDTSGKTRQLPNVNSKEAKIALEVFSKAQSDFKNIQQNNVDNQKGNSNDLTDQLLKLSELKDKGILTQEEFDAQKKKLLS